MGLRGPKGADIRAQFVSLGRPEPPDTLSAEAQTVWRDTVSRLRPSWFEGAEDLLAVYCRSVCIERALAAQLDALAPGSDGYLAIATSRRGEAAVVIRLASALRLSPQATRDRYVVPHNTPPPSVKRPWQITRSADESDEELTA